MRDNSNWDLLNDWKRIFATKNDKGLKFLENHGHRKRNMKSFRKPGLRWNLRENTSERNLESKKSD